MSWQDVATALVVLGAIGYLVTRFAPRKRRAPDVRVTALVRRKRPER